MKWFSRYLWRTSASRTCRAARPRVQLGVERLDNRVLLNAGPSALRQILGTHDILAGQGRIVDGHQFLQQTPDLTGESLALNDATNQRVGTLTIMSENSDGTFTGSFDGHRVSGWVSSTSIHFTADWSCPTGITGLEGVPLPVVQTHHVGYSGSLSFSGSGYTTSGMLDQSTALCWQDQDVCTYVPGTRIETATTVSGTFSHS
jgi:hypothetical protein